MTATKVRDAELPPSVDEIDWRHVWLARASIDAPTREKITRPKPITKMSPARRLEKLRRLRATLEPPGSWPVQVRRSWAMSPEIRAVFVGLVIAAVAFAAVYYMAWPN